MSRRPYVPERGDLAWLSFHPQAGREQTGHRPALILSPLEYNRAVGLAVVCPITNRAKGYPFEVALPPDLEVTGVVLADHVKSLDWRARRARRAGSAPSSVMAEVLGKLHALL